jgi:hypothetical protein
MPWGTSPRWIWMSSQRGRCREVNTQTGKTKTGTHGLATRVYLFSCLLYTCPLNTQTAFGLPKPQTVCKGECNTHYMRGLKWSLNDS